MVLTVGPKNHEKQKNVKNPDRSNRPVAHWPAPRQFASLLLLSHTSSTFDFQLTSNFVEMLSDI